MAKATTKKKTERNELGRTPTEQAAWDRLNEQLELVISGKLKAAPVGYNVDAVNIGTGATFSGQNGTLAEFVAMIKGENRFIGAQEALKRGWSIKGVKGLPFLRPVSVERQNDDGESETSRFFKTYYLFNLADLEHDLPNDTVVPAKLDEKALLDQCFAGIESVCKLVRTPTIPCHATSTDKAGNKSDVIVIPAASCFATTAEMLGTCFHELGHHFGKGQEWFEDYHTHRGIEELTAEFTALITMTHFGIEFNAGNAAYINSWLEDAKKSSPDPLHDSFREASKRAEKVIATIESSQPNMAKAA